jgi:esterase/lipase superfamily enzyme
MTSMLWWLWLASWCAAAEVTDDERSREHLERRVERRTARVDARRATLLALQDEDRQDDPQTVRRVERARDHLVSVAAKHTWLSRQLAAWNRPGTTVQVFYATNRARGEADGRYRPTDGDRVEYGVVVVEIPDRHPEGALEDELRILDIQPLTPDSFYIKLYDAVAQAGPRAEVLTYVHGYNNSFDYAARRTAQVAFDLERPLVPVLFSWPSHGGTSFSALKYTFDENEAARSSASLADLLDELLDATGRTPVNVIAHSMGSRVISEAMLDLRYADRQGRTFDHLVFAAPDIDAGVFERRYLRAVLEGTSEVTVYCAEDDRALQLSRSVHGGYDRLGSCRDRTVEWLGQSGVDVVDASQLYVDLVNHDKLADSPRLLSDLRAVLDDRPAEDPHRGLVEDEVGRWVLPP